MLAPRRRGREERREDGAEHGEIDALVADLQTAFAVANELRDGLIVG